MIIYTKILIIYSIAQIFLSILSKQMDCFFGVALTMKNLNQHPQNSTWTYYKMNILKKEIKYFSNN